ncbi:GNAT family N-acetyltransferase [Streptomyces sp. PT12]|uniref:GNAT family N-acetyltransferase n=1 Tax=Streptomyces sp. PT12 TaxID=1510197 RepID=UPI000DE4E797|nr:GNAT family N-acetyltransferase [Streptomyces sp. PT12]RBM16890.1 GNAT family N-acetyltransferase [Streptomyces sp. PT12]
MNIVPGRFDHPDARKLNDLVQAEYVERYGEGDLTPLDPAMFDPPSGLFLLAYDPARRPVGTGAWRAHGAGNGYEEGDAEIKRMFVVREARGRGLARRILARLEETAREAGRIRMVLETGVAQPEAIALYESSGYELLPVERKFGYYREYPNSRCFAKPL